MSALILKTAVVEHETGSHEDEPVGNEVAHGLRKVFDALLEAPESATEEGLRHLLEVVATIEQAILERLEELAGGTADDAVRVREGAEAIKHDIEGTALKQEHARKRRALADVERRVRDFFGSSPKFDRPATVAG